MKTKRSLMIAAAAAACVLFLVWSMAAAHRESGAFNQAALTPAEAHITVQLISPAPGDQALVGSPVQLIASANSQVPLDEIVFWIDNEPVKVLPVEGENTLNARVVFSWMPTQPGIYAVFARAVGVDAQSADSAMVDLEILPGGEAPAP